MHVDLPQLTSNNGFLLSGRYPGSHFCTTPLNQQSWPVGQRRYGLTLKVCDRKNEESRKKWTGNVEFSLPRLPTATKCVVKQKISGSSDGSSHFYNNFSQDVEDDSSALKKARFVYRLDEMTPQIVERILSERNWVEWDPEEHSEDEWNLYWRNSRFKTSEYHTIYPWQRLNHIPKTTNVTRKDCLLRNLRRLQGVFGQSIINFIPEAFSLPNEFTRFANEHQKKLTKLLAKESETSRKLIWICKPTDSSQGRGIFLFQSPEELAYDCPAVVQRYIDNPCTISGYKFDLRIYAVIVSFYPLVIYMHREGLVRFSTEKFSTSNLNNLYAHLTNTSLNKHSPTYSSQKERIGAGCKWTLSQLKRYFQQANLNDEQLWNKISSIVTLTMATLVGQVPKVDNCFELFGLDILVDSNLKPWLLEVNFSPALGVDCNVDLEVKSALINDIIDLLAFKDEDLNRDSSPNASQIKRHRAQIRPSLDTGLKRKRLPNMSQNKDSSAMNSETTSNVDNFLPNFGSSSQNGNPQSFSEKLTAKLPPERCGNFVRTYPITTQKSGQWNSPTYSADLMKSVVKELQQINGRRDGRSKESSQGHTRWTPGKLTYYNNFV